jgi:hypothetical protein
MVKKKTRIKSIAKVIIIIGVLALVAAVLYIVTPKAAPPAPKTSVSLTETPDYNICNVVSIDDIKSSYYGSLITGISEGARAGINAPNGTIGDSCGYGFSTDESLENSLSIQAYPYTAVINGENKEEMDASWSEVAGSNPKAYFGKDIDGEMIIYKLRVIPGGKNVMFELRQPIKNVAIDEPSALEFLVGIATKAKFDVLEPITEE